LFAVLGMEPRASHTLGKHSPLSHSQALLQDFSCAQQLGSEHELSGLESGGQAGSGDRRHLAREWKARGLSGLLCPSSSLQTLPLSLCLPAPLPAPLDPMCLRGHGKPASQHSSSQKCPLVFTLDPSNFMMTKAAGGGHGPDKAYTQLWRQ
jgi:hypothetical protein